MIFGSSFVMAEQLINELFYTRYCFGWLSVNLANRMTCGHDGLNRPFIFEMLRDRSS